MSAKKTSRCWPGYEPVPGKKPNSQGSCRPKTDSKSTPSEKEFKAKRKRQLDSWQQEHKGARRQAAQHLHGPDDEPSSQKGAARKVAAKRKVASKKKTATRTKTVAKKPAARRTATRKRATKKQAA